MTAYFWLRLHTKLARKAAWQLVNRKVDFYKTNRFESIRITNRIDSNRELECSSGGKRDVAALAAWCGVLQ